MAVAVVQNLFSAVLARNCLSSTLNYIEMQMRKPNRKESYSSLNEKTLNLVFPFIWVV